MKYFLILFGLLYFVEGKPCPQKTKAHSTKCDAFFKCIELPSRSHAWVPAKCERGLIYEANLKMCVLPEDDWECNLGDVNLSNHNRNDADDEIVVYGVGFGLTDIKNDENSETNNILDLNNTTNENAAIDSEYITEFSGDGELVDLTTSISPSEVKKMPDSSDSMLLPEPTSTESTPKYDPKLTAHLQRLSQLIAGLKKTYQDKKNVVSELQPHQLNAFLAHFNIKSKFDALQTDIENDSKDEVPIVSEKVNKTNNNIQVDLSPETKDILNNLISKRYRGTSDKGYSNSQVLINRPDGSFIVRIPQNPAQQAIDKHSDYVPKISDDTLKTVFELSKQMLANQNVPQMIPNPAYYQPVYMSSSSYSNSPFSDYSPTSFSSEEDKISSSYFLPNRKKPTTIIHNNVIPVHLSTKGGEKEIVDSYGTSLGIYPSIEDPYSTSDHSYQAAYNKRISNRYENNKFIPSRPTSNNYQYQYNQLPSEYNDQISTVRPFTYHPSPSTVAEYYTPNPHLDESNANMVFQPDQYPTVQYGNIPRPININRYEPKFGHKQQQQQHPPTVEKPDYLYHHQQQQQQHQQQQKYYNSIFPSQINPSKVTIRPNSQKVESVELEGEDDIISGNSYKHQSHQQIIKNHSGPYFINGNKNIKNKGHSSQYQSRPNQQSLLQESNKQFTSWSQRPEDPLLINLNGNIISYDIFKNSVLPLMFNTGSIDDSKIDVIKCTPGVRQPNITDCTRYYVCSKKDGKILTYSCPPYTAFNSQTMICDGGTYSICHPDEIVSRYTANQNKLIEYEATKAIEEAKRRREQTMKSQAILHLLQNDFVAEKLTDNEESVSDEKSDKNGNGSSMNSSDQSVSNEAQHSVLGTIKRRKYYCKEGDHIPDQTSIYSYFVCYKNENGIMKGHKMNCPKGLLFCPKAALCTIPEKCF